MHKHQMTETDLMEHMDTYEHFDDLVFMAESEEDEKFEDVRIFTLKQYMREKAYDEAWAQTDDVNMIEELANKFFEDHYNKKKEFVEIKHDHVVIGLDADVIDDNAVNKAILYLASIDDFTPGEVYEFGEERRLL